MVSWSLGWGMCPSHRAFHGTACEILARGRRPTRAHTGAGQGLPTATSALPAQRPSHQGAFGAGSAGHRDKARQHAGSSRPSSSSLLGLRAFPPQGRSGAVRVWQQPGGKWPRPRALGPWQSQAGPSGREARSGSTGASAAFSKQNPQIPGSICKPCQELRHSRMFIPHHSPAGCYRWIPFFGKVTQHLAAPWWEGTETQLCSRSNSPCSRGPSALDFYPFSPAVVYKGGLAWAVCTRAGFILNEHGYAWHWKHILHEISFLTSATTCFIIARSTKDFWKQTKN